MLFLWAYRPHTDDVQPTLPQGDLRPSYKYCRFRAAYSGLQLQTVPFEPVPDRGGDDTLRAAAGYVALSIAWETQNL